MKRTALIQHLKQYGCELIREGRRHSVWSTDIVKELEAFQGFSDIVFNPNRSLNCQARAAALFVALSKNELIDEQILQDKDRYLVIITGKAQLPSAQSTPHQLTLPF